MSEPSDAERPVPPAAGGQTGPGEHEVVLDLAAFLPEGTELADALEAGAPATDADPWDTGAPEPEVPAWALDDAPSTPSAPSSPPAPPAAPAEPSIAPAPEPAPADESVESPVDPSATAALDRIDEDLAAVDDALVALDAGTPERSPLLRDLLG